MRHLDVPLSTVHTPARREIEDMLGRLDALEAPVVSLYLDVQADTDPTTPAQRADAALRPLKLGRGIREDVQRRLDALLRSAAEGTVAVFAVRKADGSLETQLLRVAPPLPGGASPAVARWGNPWAEPLRLLLASEQPVVAVVVDARRARVFVHDLGDVVEVRTDAWTEDFVKNVADQIAPVVAAGDGTRLLLLGETRQRNAVEEALSTPLKAALLASEPAPVDLDLATSQWVEPLTERIRSARHAEEERVLADIEAHGVVGVEEVLGALQQGDLELVAVPADVDVDVVHCLGTDWLAASERAARRVCPDSPIDRAPLKHFLLRATRQGRAQLRVLRGSTAHRLVTHGGLVAGLPRRS